MAAQSAIINLHGVDKRRVAFRVSSVDVGASLQQHGHAVLVFGSAVFTTAATIEDGVEWDPSVLNLLDGVAQFGPTVCRSHTHMRQNDMHAFIATQVGRNGEQRSLGTLRKWRMC